MTLFNNITTNEMKPPSRVLNALIEQGMNTQRKVLLATLTEQERADLTVDDVVTMDAINRERIIDGIIGYLRGIR